MDVNNIFLVGGSASPKADFFSDKENKFVSFGKIAYPHGSNILRAVCRHPLSREILFGGRNILTKYKNGIRTNIWTASGIAENTYIYAINYGYAGAKKGFLIGGSGPTLVYYDGTNYTDLSSDLTGWTDGSIYAIACHNDNYWLIGGEDAGGDPKLFKYDGTTFTDLSSDIATPFGANGVTALAYDTIRSLWYIGGESGKFVQYDTNCYLDLTSSMGMADDIYRVYFSLSHRRIYIGGANKNFRQSYQPEWVYSYNALVEPDSDGWTLAGTDEASIISNALNIATADEEICNYRRNFTFDTNAGLTIIARVKVNSGGSVDNNSCRLRVYAGSGGAGIRFESGAPGTLRFYDYSNEANYADYAVTTTSYLNVFITISGTTAKMYVGTTLRATLTLDTAPSGTTAEIRFGDSSAVDGENSDSDWQFIRICNKEARGPSYFTDLSASVLGFGAGDGIRAIGDAGHMVFLAGDSGKINSYDKTTFRDISNSLMGLFGINIIDGHNYKGAIN